MLRAFFGAVFAAVAEEAGLRLFHIVDEIVYFRSRGLIGSGGAAHRDEEDQ